MNFTKIGLVTFGLLGLFGLLADGGLDKLLHATTDNFFEVLAPYLISLAILCMGFIIKGNTALPKEKSAPPIRSISWGYKTAWYAIKSPADPSEVAKILGVKELKEVSWPVGVGISYGPPEQCGIFVSNAVEGWTFAVGMALANEHTENLIGTYESNLIALSEKFGEAQFFATHRVVDMHIWARAVAGKLTRSYFYVGEQGEVFRNLGEPTPAEVSFTFLTKPMDKWDKFPDEEDVLSIASSWSINPVTFEDKKESLESAKGLLGT